jgi:peptidoglycan/xylan/chitin deacetylase (PgdA/CDA1 family)
LSSQGRVTVTWDVEPESHPEIAGDARRIVDYVIQHAQPGSIILLHPMYRSGQHTIAAVPGIIEGLQRRGYRLVGVSDLLAFRS